MLLQLLKLCCSLISRRSSRIKLECKGKGGENIYYLFLKLRVFFKTLILRVLNFRKITIGLYMLKYTTYMVHMCTHTYIHVFFRSSTPTTCTGGTLSVCAAQVYTRVFRIPYSHILYTVYIFSFTVASGSTRSKPLTPHRSQ